MSVREHTDGAAALRPRRVLVTGMGLWSPLGTDVAQSFAAAVAGRSAIRPARGRTPPSRGPAPRRETRGSAPCACMIRVLSGRHFFVI